MGVLSILESLRGGFAPTDLFQLPTRQLTLNEDDGVNIIFKDLFGVCVDMEIENLDSNAMTMKIDSLSSHTITLGVGVTKTASRVKTKSIHVTSASPSYVIRAAVVDVFQAAQIPGVDL